MKEQNIDIWSELGASVIQNKAIFWDFLSTVLSLLLAPFRNLKRRAKLGAPQRVLWGKAATTYSAFSYCAQC